MRRANLLALLTSGVVFATVFTSLAQQQPSPAVDASNPAVFASSLPVGAVAPTFDVTNVVTNETLCYL